MMGVRHREGGECHTSHALDHDSEANCSNTKHLEEHGHRSVRSPAVVRLVV